MTKMRLSYTIVRTAEEGMIDDAVRMLQGDWSGYDNQAMQLGQEWHKKFERETIKTEKMPVLFAYDLGKTTAELKKVVDVNDWLEFVVKVDALTDTAIADHKVGKTTLSACMSTYQLGCYSLAFPNAKYGIINRYYPYGNEVDVGIRHLTDQCRRESAEWIGTWASILRDYCEERDIKWYRENV